jgi:uncharacterized membrane protein YqjE
LEANLLQICFISFVAVFALLLLLAGAMRLITTAFPETQTVTDAALVAAVTSTIASAYPGSRVTRIEEIR